MSSAPAIALDEQSSRTFFGHPKGLAFLAFTEAWERFSYYGMAALLVLYMVNQLLLPGHVEHVAGFAAMRGLLESAFGPMSTQALASQIFGLYSGFVYFTPILGGWIGDRIGQRSAVVLGALSMSGGHLAMAFDQSFLLALLLLIIGSGLLKGNISAQVGSIYPPDDEARRTRGFAIFSTAINFGAVAGPLLCGYLGERYGWHIGFGAAALFMLGALATYLSGYRHLPARVEQAAKSATAPLTREDRRTIAALVAVMAITVLAYIAYYQLANVLPIWIQAYVNLDAGGFAVPIEWFYSIDPLASILSVPLLFALWNRQARADREPPALTKIGDRFVHQRKCSPDPRGGNCRFAWPRAVDLAGPVLRDARRRLHVFWPPLLALVSRAAPPRSTRR